MDTPKCALCRYRIGAFIAKLVVTPAGPSALLLTSASVQVVVGLFLAPPIPGRRRSSAAALRRIPSSPMRSRGSHDRLPPRARGGPAAVIVPLVATSPALAGILGIAFLHERASGRQYVGIVLAMAGGVLLSTA
jgi:drug/metabolite transporter (DMT)-like permease